MLALARDRPRGHPHLRGRRDSMGRLPSVGCYWDGTPLMGTCTTSRRVPGSHMVPVAPVLLSSTHHLPLPQISRGLPLPLRPLSSRPQLTCVCGHVSVRDSSRGHDSCPRISNAIPNDADLTRVTPSDNSEGRVQMQTKALVGYERGAVRIFCLAPLSGFADMEL